MFEKINFPTAGWWHYGLPAAPFVHTVLWDKPGMHPGSDVLSNMAKQYQERYGVR